MNDNEGKSKGSSIADKAKTIAKIKKNWPIISVVLAAIGYILAGVIIIIIIMIPIMYIRDNIESISTTVSTGVEKILNLSSGNGWNTNEESFFKKLKDEYQRFENFRFKEGEFDAPLIAATVHYNKLFNSRAYESPKDQVSSGQFSESSYDNADTVTVNKDQSASFYNVATDKLGTAFTVVPSYRKLIGHLVNTKFGVTCVSVPTGTDIFNLPNWDSFGNTTIAALNDFIDNFKYTFVDSAGDNVVKSVMTTENIIKYMGLVIDYARTGQSKPLTDMQNLGYELENDNFVAETIDMVKASNLNFSCPNIDTESDKSISVPILHLIKYIDYDKYKDYLKNVYIPSTLFPNKQADPETVNRIVDDIFRQKDGFEYLTGIKDITAAYIPGLSSLPIQVESGKDWKAKVSRGFAMGTAECYVGGVYSGSNTCNHTGIDFAYPMGTPVRSIANGYVTNVGFSSSGLGNYIIIGHDTDGDGKYNYYSAYGHLSVVEVSAFSRVGGGQEIGKVGSTGNSTGPHLHFELRDANEKPFDPAPILDAIANKKDDNPFGGSMKCNNLNIDQLNQDLKTKVDSAGWGTRNGVVAAAKFLSQDLGIKLPYFWGSRYPQLGFNSDWGCNKVMGRQDDNGVWVGGTEAQTAGLYFPNGLDCTGFVSWSIINGGYNSTEIQNREYAADYGGSTIDTPLNNDTIKKIKPGDIAKVTGHVGLVIGVDPDSCTYYVAEEPGYPQGLEVNAYHCGQDSGSWNFIRLMDDFYNNSSYVAKRGD